MLVSEQQDRATFRTEVQGLRATWLVEQGIPRIMFVNEVGSDRPAYRWTGPGEPGIPLPACDNGHIAFPAGDYPTLAEVAVLLPEYEETLWEEVRAEFREHVTPHPAVNPCMEGLTCEWRRFDNGWVGFNSYRPAIVEPDD